MENDKFHAFYYPCPICHIVLIGCDNVDCDDCDRYSVEGSDCAGGPSHYICQGNITCKCHPQQVVAHLVCENMELQEEVASLTEQLNAVYFKIDNTF